MFVRSKKQQMKKITVAKGDGIGPEIMDATLKIILAIRNRRDRSR
jgi:isocitrate dehydrogenase